MKWTQKELETLYQQAIEKASRDKEFFEKMKKDLNAALEELAGRPVPKDFSLNFIERDANFVRNMVTPDFTPDELNMKELQEVQGGISFLAIFSACFLAISFAGCGADACGAAGCPSDNCAGHACGGYGCGAKGGCAGEACGTDGCGGYGGCAGDADAVDACGALTDCQVAVGVHQQSLLVADTHQAADGHNQHDTDHGHNGRQIDVEDSLPAGGTVQNGGLMLLGIHVGQCRDVDDGTPSKVLPVAGQDVQRTEGSTFQEVGISLPSQILRNVVDQTVPAEEQLQHTDHDHQGDEVGGGKNGLQHLCRALAL